MAFNTHFTPPGRDCDEKGDVIKLADVEDSKWLIRYGR